mgnify:CR=1 FL=1
MRKQSAAARDFPPHRIAQSVQINLCDNKPILPGEMFGQRLLHLIGGGHVNIAICQIDWRAKEHTLALKGGPLVCCKNLEGGVCHPMDIDSMAATRNPLRMDLDELLPRRADDPLVLLTKQDLDPLSVDELNARIAVLDSEIARTRGKIEGAVNHLASAEALFKH